MSNIKKNFDMLTYKWSGAFGGAGHFRITMCGPVLEFWNIPMTNNGKRDESRDIKRRALSQEESESLFAAIGHLPLIIVPPFVVGEDGCSHQLTIRSGCNSITLGWWDEATEEWSILNGFPHLFHRFEKASNAS